MADSTLEFDFDVLHRAEIHLDEEYLVEALRCGAEEAYEALIIRYQQPVYNLVYRLMADPTDAADVVQEVFLKIFRNIQHFKGQSSLKTWIYRISFNEAYNHRRWFSRHKKQEIGLEADDDESQGYVEILPDPGRSAYELACGRETQELIGEALAAINPLFRAAVVLRDIEELSYEEIADILQVSLGTVKSRILRGREALRKSLTKRLHATAGEREAPRLVKVIG